MLSQETGALEDFLRRRFGVSQESSPRPPVKMVPEECFVLRCRGKPAEDHIDRAIQDYFSQQRLEAIAGKGKWGSYIIAAGEVVAYEADVNRQEQGEETIIKVRLWKRQ